MSFFAARDPYFEGRDQIRESLKNARAAFERWRALPDNAESSKAKADLLAELQNLIGDTRDLEEMCIDRVESDRHAYGIDQNEIVNRKQFVSNTLAAIDELKASLAVSKSKRSDLLPGPAGGAGRPMQQRAAQESPSPEDEARKMRMQMLEKREDEQLDEILRAGGLQQKRALLDEYDAEKAVRTKTRQPKRQRPDDHGEEVLAPKVTRKILDQARKQLDEIEADSDGEGRAGSREGLPAGAEIAPDSDADSDSDGAYDDRGEIEEEGFEEMTEEEERTLNMFMPSDAGSRRTLADIIMEKIKEKESGAADVVEPHEDKMNPKVLEVYTGVGDLLKSYSSGKIPKAFKIVPSLRNWEEVLLITRPDEWSCAAVYQATRLFASNLNAKMAQRFYSTILLPRVQHDIQEHKKLNFHLYMALKKALYKPAAFYKGLLLPLCEGMTCSIREAVILSSILSRVSVPVLHSAAAIIKLCEMAYSPAVSIFLRTLIEKKYSLPYRVIDAIVSHFLSFLSEMRQMPVIWHLSLLAFVQRYKGDITAEAKESFKLLLRQQEHAKITPEIRRELFQGANQMQI
eukprot:tig00000829_g4658.t1